MRACECVTELKYCLVNSADILQVMQLEKNHCLVAHLSAVQLFGMKTKQFACFIITIGPLIKRIKIILMLLWNRQAL